MDVKTIASRLARAIGRQPAMSRLLRAGSVRRLFAGLPGGSRLLSHMTQDVPWERIHPFDVMHGTDTSGFVPVIDVEPTKEALRAQASAYGGSQPSIVRAALAALPPLQSFAFVDLGCGKGRPLLVASEFPFREIVGVELSQSLAQVARQNADIFAQQFPQRTPIRIVAGDAGRFPLPAGDLVLFLYHPFGDEVMAGVIDALHAALAQEPRTVFVVYYNPVVGHRFDASPALRRHFAATIPYAIDEIGYGPDTDDPIVIWHGGRGCPPTGSGANARIQVVDPGRRVALVPL